MIRRFEAPDVGTVFVEYRSSVPPIGTNIAAHEVREQAETVGHYLRFSTGDPPETLGFVELEKHVNPDELSDDELLDHLEEARNGS